MKVYGVPYVNNHLTKTTDSSKREKGNRGQSQLFSEILEKEMSDKKDRNKKFRHSMQQEQNQEEKDEELINPEEKDDFDRNW